MPPHFWCSAHSLNLVAAGDSRAALKPRTSEYTRNYYHIFGVLRKVWSRYNQSVVFADLVKDKFTKALITPSPTRWNSTYDSVLRILDLYKENRVSFGAMLTTADCPQLNQNQIAFLQEWSGVMGHLAEALDLIQGDKGIYLGHLLPTIVYLRKYLLQERLSATKCKPLVDALLAGLSKRFDGYFERREMLLASVYLPEFKAAFLETNAQRDQAKTLLLEEAHALEDHPSSQLSQDALQQERGRGFFKKIPKVTDTAAEEVGRFFLDPSEGLQSILAYPRVKKVFTRYNTILPSSASSERLFSKAKLVLRRTRQRIGDDSFESQLLLSANKAL